MVPNGEAGDCGGDYYCDANYVCGSDSACTEIDVMEANGRAWHSTLHLVNDATVDQAGSPMGLGGGYSDFSVDQYGPGGSHVDTRAPFNVAVRFPVTSAGKLAAVEVALSQGGGAATLTLNMTEYSYYDIQGQQHSDGIDQVSARACGGVGERVSDTKACRASSRMRRSGRASERHESVPRVVAHAVERVSERATRKRAARRRPSFAGPDEPPSRESCPSPSFVVSALRPPASRLPRL